MGKYCEKMGDVVCPICGKIGELKKYRPNLKYKDKHYWRVDHYSGGIPEYGEFSGRFLKSCYIGRELPKTIKYHR